MVEPVSIAFVAGALGPVYLKLGLGFWREFRIWCRYFRAVVVSFHRFTNKEMFTALIMEISPYCLDDKFKSFETITKINQETKTNELEMYALPKPNTFKTIKIAGIEITILPLSKDNICVDAYEFSCSKKHKATLYIYLGGIMKKAGFSNSSIERVFPGWPMKSIDNDGDDNDNETDGLRLRRR